MAHSFRGSTPSTSASLRSSELEEAARALTRRIQRPEPIAHIYPADDPKLEQVLSKLRVSLRKRTGIGDGGVRGLARHFRIVDRNGNGALDPSEFFKVCALNRLPLSDDDVRLLFAHFDSDRSGEVAYDEFLRAVRGRLSPMRRRLAMRAFELLDRRHPDGPRGFLTVDNLKEAYSTSEHPAVRAGHLTREEALEDFLRGFEGPHGDRDGRVTRDEWERYYEEVSMAFDSDDAFGAMLQSAWRKLTVKAADGSTVPALTFVPQAEVARLEERLRAVLPACENVPCRPTVMRELCFAPRNWARPIASSRCSPVETAGSAPWPAVCARRRVESAPASNRSTTSMSSSTKASHWTT